MLRQSIAKFIADQYSFATRRQIINSEPGYSEPIWQKFAELGWLMVPFAHTEGGLGGSAVDVIALLEEFGKGLVIEPYIASLILAGRVLVALGSAQQKNTILPGLMAGELQLALACNEKHSRYDLANVQTTATKTVKGYTLSGYKTVVLNGGRADWLVVVARTCGDQHSTEGISLFLVAADSQGIERKEYRTVDGYRAADIYLNAVEVTQENLLGPVDEGFIALQNTIDFATLAVSAEALGAMEILLNKTVEYSKTRRQFGVAIGSFQALQHRMADMYIEYEQAKSAVLLAAMKSDGAGAVDAKMVSAAKSRVGRAARLIGQEAIQIHGGIGVTDELDVSHYFKRLTTIQYLFGSTDWHTARFARL